MKFFPVLLGIALSSLVWLSGCNKDGEEEDLPNEISLTGASTFTVTEKDTTITVSYEFIVAARSAGTLKITSSADNLTYGVNYTTSPAEEAGEIAIAFDAMATGVSFQIVVSDDDQNLPDGSVTFTMAEVTGENSTIGSADSFELTIIDNEGESINPASEETLMLGEAVPGTSGEAVEVAFTSLNLINDITVSASSGFAVGATVDGEFGATATISSTATSFFVKAAPDAAANEGLLMGTVTLTSGEATATVDVEVVVSGSVGVLFWAEDFDYPVDDTYPSYGDNGFSGACVPVSAWYKMAVAYNGANPDVPVMTGLQRTGHMDTWYVQNRMTAISMVDNPLTFTGYPGSGIGRAARIAFDGGQLRQNNNNCENWESKNAAIIRRFVDNDNEITSGNVYLASMIKVNEVFAEETPVLKNAIIMLTGDASFVGVNAMKLNVRDDGNGGFNFGVSKSGDDGSVVYGETSYALGTTYAVIMKVEINEDLEGDAPNDVVSVYVFEEGETIPTFEDPNLMPEAKIDASNQEADAHDVTSGLETVFIREVADAFAAGGAANIAVQNVDFSGIRVATSWHAVLKDASQALHDSVSDDPLMTIRQGNDRCPDSGFVGGTNGNNDL